MITVATVMTANKPGRVPRVKPTNSVKKYENQPSIP